MIMPIYTTTSVQHSLQQLAPNNASQKNSNQTATGLVAALCGLHQKHLMNHPFYLKNNK
jgi:hypothetical protein